MKIHGTDIAESNRRRASQRHVGRWETCTLCPIGALAKRHVFARGTLPCDVLFVGEAPGREEDRTGLPFVGKAGRELDDWIEATWSPAIGAVGVSWTYALTNLVTCRPSAGGSNRPPSVLEEENCRPRLREFIELSGAKCFVLLGRYARDAFDGTDVPKLHLYHPSYVLRQSYDTRLRFREEQIGLLCRFLEEHLCRTKS